MEEIAVRRFETAARGDPALEVFCREERPQLVAAVTTYCGDADVAEEVAQEALARACDRWEEVRVARSPGAWTYRVAVNLVNDRFRRRKVERRARELLVDADGWHRDRDAATVVAVRRAVELLPPRQRAAVTLRYLLDWSVAETADALDTSEGAVRVLTHRGVMALREHFSRGGRRVMQVIATLGVVLLAATATVVAVALARAEPVPVFIDDPGLPTGAEDEVDDAPAEPADDPGGRPIRVEHGDLELRVSGDLEGRYGLAGPRRLGNVAVSSRASVSSTLRFGTRDRTLIQLEGELHRGGVVSGDDVHVTLVIDGYDFFAADGECAVTVDTGEPRVEAALGDPRSSVVVTLLSLRCVDLEGGRGDERLTIDVDGWWRR